MRAREFRNTVELINNGFYYTEGTEKVAFNKIADMVAGTKFYSNSFSVHDIVQNQQPTAINVVNADCLEEGIRLLDMGYNPAILNMASRQNSGGEGNKGCWSTRINYSFVEQIYFARCISLYRTQVDMV